MSDGFELTKRNFLQGASSTSIVLIGSLAPSTVLDSLITPTLAAAGGKQQERNKGKVTPPEDLMREHGVLDRVLLIYEAGMRKLAANEDFDHSVMIASAEIVRDFIENYHETSEEEHVFPRFMNANQMVDLVNTLLEQHVAGRLITENILKFAPTSRKNTDDRRQLVGAMQSFIAMYRPHAAREDTDLFPKLRDLVSSNEYDAMAEEFEKKERQLFGDDGFETMAQRLAGLEQSIGIHDISQFTPR
jgi:hemerythrin-like domain-containing protein